MVNRHSMMAGLVLYGYGGRQPKCSRSDLFEEVKKTGTPKAAEIANGIEMLLPDPSAQQSSNSTESTRVPGVGDSDE